MGRHPAEEPAEAEVRREQREQMGVWREVDDHDYDGGGGGGGPNGSGEGSGGVATRGRLGNLRGTARLTSWLVQRVLNNDGGSNLQEEMASVAEGLMSQLEILGQADNPDMDLVSGLLAERLETLVGEPMEAAETLEAVQGDDSDNDSYYPESYVSSDEDDEEDEDEYEDMEEENEDGPWDGLEPDTDDDEIQTPPAGTEP